MYELITTDTFVRDLKKLDPSSKAHLHKLLKKLVLAPDRFKPLHSFPGHYRLRFGTYRLIFRVDGNKVVLMFVRKRDVVYRGMRVG